MALDERPSHQGAVLTSAALYFLICGHLNHARYKHIVHALFRKRQAKRQFHVLTGADQGRVSLKLSQERIDHGVNF